MKQFRWYRGLELVWSAPCCVHHLMWRKSECRFKVRPNALSCRVTQSTSYRRCSDQRVKPQECTECTLGDITKVYRGADITIQREFIPVQVCPRTLALRRSPHTRKFTYHPKFATHKEVYRSSPTDYYL